MSLLAHAELELDIIGETGDMRKHILYMVNEFAKEGHSGTSANHAINVLDKLLRFEPLTPLTGEDREWTEVSDNLYQNKRCFHVFKENGVAYDGNGIVFYEVTKDKNGQPYKIYFTNLKSRTPVTFPYTPTTVYQEVTDDE